MKHEKRGSSIDLTSEYGQKISRAILIRCGEKKMLGSSCFDNTAIDHVRKILKDQKIDVPNDDIESVLEQLTKKKGKG